MNIYTRAWICFAFSGTYIQCLEMRSHCTFSIGRFILKHLALILQTLMYILDPKHMNSPINFDRTSLMSRVKPMHKCFPDRGLNSLFLGYDLSIVKNYRPAADSLN